MVKTIKTPAQRRNKYPADNPNVADALKMVSEILELCDDRQTSPGTRVRIIGETVGKLGGVLEHFDATNCQRILRAAAELHGITL